MKVGLSQTDEQIIAFTDEDGQSCAVKQVVKSRKHPELNLLSFHTKKHHVLLTRGLLKELLPHLSQFAESGELQ